MQGDEAKLRERFGSAIRELRLRQGLSQEELAHRAGLSRNHVGGLERAEISPGLVVLYRLADAFGMSPENLLREVDSNRET